MAYATRDDVFNLALSAQAFVVRARPYDALDIATGIITLKAHGLAPTDQITLEVTSGGCLPTGLSAGVAYGVIVVSFDSFRLVDPASGNPVTWYSAEGSGWSVTVDMMRRLDLNLEADAAYIDEHLTAHEPPLTTPYPLQVVRLNARLTARSMVVSLQFDNQAYRVAVDRLFDQKDSDDALLKSWLSGKPVQPRPGDQDTVPNNGARAGQSRRPSNWTNGRIW